MDTNIPVVVLAGGIGLRMRDYQENIPKALVPIGNMAVIHHVMKIFYHQNFQRFIICLGYKSDSIKEYFYHYHWKAYDFNMTMGMEDGISKLAEDVDKFKITFVDTGHNTQTGGRIKKIEKYIDTDNFFITYCDGLANIDLKELLDFHIKMNKVVTLTAVHPISPFGVVGVEDGVVVSFKEKPSLEGLINGGFFAAKKKIFDYLDENAVLEEEPLRKLAEERQLAAFQHNGFWACMDTHKDAERLNKLWDTGFLPNVGVKYQKAPWKIWSD